MRNTRDKLGRTPLLIALIYGAGADAVRELIFHGEDPTEEDDVGRTALEAALLYCSPDVIEVILNALKTSTKKMPVVNTEELLSIADDRTDSDAVKSLIQEHLMQNLNVKFKHLKSDSISKI